MTPHKDKSRSAATQKIIVLVTCLGLTLSGAPVGWAEPKERQVAQGPDDFAEQFHRLNQAQVAQLNRFLNPDPNQDAKVDIGDLTGIGQYFGEAIANPQDVNGDGVVDKILKAEGEVTIYDDIAPEISISFATSTLVSYLSFPCIRITFNPLLFKRSDGIISTRRIKIRRVI